MGTLPSDSSAHRDSQQGKERPRRGGEGREGTKPTGNRAAHPGSHAERRRRDKSPPDNTSLLGGCVLPTKDVFGQVRRYLALHFNTQVACPAHQYPKHRALAFCGHSITCVFPNRSWGLSPSVRTARGEDYRSEKSPINVSSSLENTTRRLDRRHAGD